jgi:hypothetical protein
MRNASIDLAAAAKRGIEIVHTDYYGSNATGLRLCRTPPAAHIAPSHTPIQARPGRRLKVEDGEAPCLARILAGIGKQAPNPDRRVAEQGAERRTVMTLAGLNATQASHERRRSPTMVTCAGTISAWSAAVSCSSRSRRPTSTSVEKPGSSSAASFTRQTIFGTSLLRPMSPKSIQAGTPSRPGEFHPEPLSDPDFDTLASSGSRHRNESCRLPPNIGAHPVASWLAFDVGDLPPLLHGHYPASSPPRGSPPLGGASAFRPRGFSRLSLFRWHRRPGFQIPCV